MRRWTRRKSNVEPESSHRVVEGDAFVELAPVLWSVEQLNALEPMTGPSHRTWVPIVRSSASVDLNMVQD